MKHLILAGTVALSSIAAPLAAHACDPGSYGYQSTGYPSGYVQQSYVQPSYVPPAYVPPAYVQSAYVQPAYVSPPRVFVRGGFGARGGGEGWRHREFRGGGFEHGRGGWRR